jgi:hypothetical protein
MLADPVDRDDIRVVQPGSGFCLPLEPPPQLGVANDMAGQNFQRDVPAQRNLFRLVNNAHSALAYFADDSKVAELL